MNGMTMKTAALYKKFTLFSLLTVAGCLVVSAPAYADAMGIVMCDIVTTLYGNAGRGIATLAIIVLGIGATLGKVTWGLCITVGVGIAAIFNAAGIVGALTGGLMQGIGLDAVNNCGSY